MKAIISPPSSKRPKAAVIKVITESAPWVLLSKAIKESGVPERDIKAHLQIRKFGNAFYVSPQALNAWIIGTPDKSPQSNIGGEQQ